MTIIEFSPMVAELFPAIMGLVAAAGLGGLALYTKRVARLAQESSTQAPDPAE